MVQISEMLCPLGSCFSAPFSVSNGVRQGSVLSPLLFAVYIDELLSDLSSCGVGCYCGDLFASCVCYADDIVLLAPCQSALRTMLSICSNFATAHKLEFDTTYLFQENQTLFISCFDTPKWSSATSFGQSRPPGSYSNLQPP